MLRQSLAWWRRFRPPSRFLLVAAVSIQLLVLSAPWLRRFFLFNFAGSIDSEARGIEPETAADDLEWFTAIDTDLGACSYFILNDCQGWLLEARCVVDRETAVALARERGLLEKGTYTGRAPLVDDEPRREARERYWPPAFEGTGERWSVVEKRLDGSTRYEETLVWFDGVMWWRGNE